MHKTLIPSPIGPMTAISDGAFLTFLDFREPEILTDEDEILAKTRRELQLYFDGKLREFTVPTRLTGTPFRMKIWHELTKIPYGETISYGELAKRVGQPTASRAVGGANHHNPVSIIVPCHRVIGADGSLTGYGGGLEAKKFLLELERNFLKNARL